MLGDKPSLRIELCCECSEPTGRAGRAEDSIYCRVCNKGPFCEEHFHSGGDCCLDCQIRKMNGGCSCHASPPCSWCESLSEEEANIYTATGMNGLNDHWTKQEDE